MNMPSAVKLKDNNMSFCIKDGYTHRTQELYFDDTGLKDEWQKEVYQYARDVAEQNQYQTIMDFGCGSAFKLLDNFKDYNTIGIDLPQTVEYLQNTYPERTWSSALEVHHNVDILIASDVIEHMVDPNVLIDYIKACSPKEIILSTPERDLVVEYLGGSADGPPHNGWHIREWTRREFIKYIAQHFDILNHIITNKQQATQLIHCRMR